MATKRQELEGIARREDLAVIAMAETARVVAQAEGEARGCLGKAALDEPLFVLRAQDRCAPYAVRAWVERARASGDVPPAKLEEAQTLLAAMELWQEQHGCKWPD